MITNQLLNNTIPTLTAEDTISKALQLFTDFNFTHLPVVHEDKFLGLLSRLNLLDAEQQNRPISFLQNNFLPIALKDNDYFLNAVNFCSEYNTSIVPIVNNDNKLLGVITPTDLLKTLGIFTGANALGGIIVLEMERSQFATSEISRIVESNDAIILHLNTTIHLQTGRLTVYLHLNKNEIAAVVAGFERHDYEVVYHFGNPDAKKEVHNNYLHLMNYLEL